MDVSWVTEVYSSKTRQRVIVWPARVRSLRKRLGMSLPQFARKLGIASGVVESWEFGKRIPSSAARTLLTIIEKHPELLKE